jgi:hypothetical protein
MRLFAAIAMIALATAGGIGSSSAGSSHGRSPSPTIGQAVGYYDGKRRTIRLDACSLCNLKGIGADLAVLLPGAQG